MTKKASKEFMMGVASAMTDHARAQCIKLDIEKHGPVYVRALVPRHARLAFQLDQYTPYFIGSVDPARLAHKQIARYALEYGKAENDMPGFCAFLKIKGYIIFMAAHELGPVYVGESK